MVEPKDQNPEENKELEDILQLGGLDSLIKAKVNEIENNLADKLNETISNIYNKIAEDMKAASASQATQIQAAIQTLPGLVQKQVEGQLQANIAAITDQIGRQFEGKVRELTGGDNPGAGGTVNRLIRDASIGDIVQLIQAWKQPSSDQQLASQIRLLTTGMNMGSKMKSGELTPKDIQDSFEIKPRE